MKKSSSYNKNDKFGLLLIGVPKSGKTNLALAFPKPAVLDCDGNLAGAMRRGAGDFLFENPNVDDNGKELTPSMRWQKCCKFMSDAIKLPKSECETIIIDGLSIMANYLIDSLSQNSKLIVGGEKVMDQSLWQPFRNKMQTLMLQGRACDKLFIVTAHETVVQDQGTGNVVGYRPLIPGQLKDNLAGLFSDCWRTETKAKTKGSEYLVRVQPRTMMQIGNSLGITDIELDVSNLSPTEVWTKLAPYFA
jgi:hypothetical protein